MLNKDYRDILLALNAEKVDFILVGAYALAAHGYPRSTMDIDIWISPSPDNSQSVLKALKQFGAPLHDLNENDLQRPDTIFQIGVAPRRIDIITGLSGLKFSEAVKNVIKTTIDGVKINILSIDDLIHNKIASGRPKDLLDAEMLKSMIKNQV
jgi:hypothetical protein